ncbi:hypothetical protein [Rhodococcus sp. B10]|uniref:hypothetical protein n=1 Tax=Rhodococcus sp. B10 TaxID=2695876 RepID=UPI00142FC97A|nr:hypothetical protein [Rhodococcus sp. B10]NIL77143.1 hypothetical protein [Rhodococcus sp. B10]
MKKSVVALLAVPFAITLAAALAGCSSSDSETAESASAAATSQTSATSTFVPVAESCLLQLDDLATLKPPVSNQYKSIDAGRDETSLSCSYIAPTKAADEQFLYIAIHEIAYDGASWDYGDGSSALAGSTCADGSIMTDEVVATDLESTRKQLESRIICENKPVTNKHGFEQGYDRQLEVQAEAFPEVGEGLYCIIPSNCFLLTQDNLYVIELPRKVNTPLSAARTYSPFGGYEGSKMVANLIVEKAAASR